MTLYIIESNIHLNKYYVTDDDFICGLSDTNDIIFSTAYYFNSTRDIIRRLKENYNVKSVRKMHRNLLKIVYTIEINYDPIKNPVQKRN